MQALEINGGKFRAEALVAKFVTSGMMPQLVREMTLDRSTADLSLTPEEQKLAHQQAFQQLNIGMYVTHGPVVGGFWYRNRDSFIVLVGIQQNTFRIGYSYDVTLSKLTNATAGSHEVSLALVIPCKKKGPRYRMLDCPSF